jgi:hypothetical protein
MITLTKDGNTVTLPADLQWSDEFSWSPVEQSTGYSLNGALVVQEGLKQKGRTITLVGGSDAAWVRRADLLALHALAATPGVFSLDYHGRLFSVKFRYPQPIETAPVLPLADPGPDDWYSLTVYFFEVAA